MPRCSQTAATASSSSTAPKLVEPAVAATAKTSRSVASRAAPRAAPSILPRSSASTSTTSTSRMRAASRSEEWPPPVIATAGRSRALAAAPPGVARHRQGAEVARRAATDEDATRSRREADRLSDPAERLVLGVDRAGGLDPPIGGDRRGRDREVEEDRGRGRRIGDEAEEAGMAGVDAGRCQHLLEDRKASLGPSPCSVIVFPASCRSSLSDLGPFSSAGPASRLST